MVYICMGGRKASSTTRVENAIAQAQTQKFRALGPLESQMCHKFVLMLYCKTRASIPLYRHETRTFTAAQILK